MTETVQIGDTVDAICNLKAAVNALESQYKKNLQEQQTVRKANKNKASSKQPPMFIMIPLEQKGTGDDGSITGGKGQRKQRNRQDCDFDDFENFDVVSLDCDKRKMRGRGGDRYDKHDGEQGGGLRGGVQQARCSCVHRDGLQDDCPLPQCQENPDCLTKPWASCQPARLFRQMHPEIFPPDRQTY